MHYKFSSVEVVQKYSYMDRSLAWYPWHLSFHPHRNITDTKLSFMFESVLKFSLFLVQQLTILLKPHYNNKLSVCEGMSELRSFYAHTVVNTFCWIIALSEVYCNLYRDTRRRWYLSLTSCMYLFVCVYLAMLSVGQFPLHAAWSSTLKETETDFLMFCCVRVSEISVYSYHNITPSYSGGNDLQCKSTKACFLSRDL
jgi:hypothetical protein